MALVKKILLVFFAAVALMTITIYFSAKIMAPQFFGFWYHRVNINDPQWNIEKFDRTIWLNEKSRRAGMLADFENREEPLDRSDLLDLLGERDGPYLGQDFYIPYSLGNFHRSNEKENCSAVANFDENSGYFNHFILWCEPLSK